MHVYQRENVASTMQSISILFILGHGARGFRCCGEVILGNFGPLPSRRSGQTYTDRAYHAHTSIPHIGPVNHILEKGLPSMEGLNTHMRLHGNIRTAQRTTHIVHHTVVRHDSSSDTRYMAYLETPLDGMKSVRGTLENLLPCPLPSRCRVPLRVVLVQVSDVGHKRVVGIRVSQHRADRK